MFAIFRSARLGNPLNSLQSIAACLQKTWPDVVMPAALVFFFVGCDYAAGTTDNQTPISGGVRDSGTPSAFGPFESSLQEQDLSRFQGLPVAIQEALEKEAQAKGDVRALDSLRSLPDGVRPLETLVSTGALTHFDELDEERRRFVLLSGYSVAFEGKAPEDPARCCDEPADFLESLIDTLHRRDTAGDRVPFSEDTMLSPTARSRLASLDPLIQRAFRLVWSELNVRPDDITSTARQIEDKIAAVSVQLPEIESLGLTEDALQTALQTPNGEVYVREHVAASIARTGQWDSRGLAVLEGVLHQVAAPGGRELFARGLRPVANANPMPIACESRPKGGSWPTWAMSDLFRTMQPDELIARKPRPSEVLPSDALAKVEALDSQLKDGLYSMWYSAGEPWKVEEVACHAKSLEAELLCIPLTTVPPLEELLSPELIEAYSALPQVRQDTFNRQLVSTILRGSVLVPPHPGGSRDPVHACKTTPEEFVSALKTWSELTVRAHMPTPTPQ